MSEITWGIPVVMDLFFAGLGAGSFCLGAITSKKKGLGWEACSRMASFLAPLAVVIGLSMLILDLRYKTRFWMTLGVLNLNSPMSIGVWLLSAFFLVSILFALYGFPAPVRQQIPWLGKLSVWDRVEWKNRLAGIGVLLALGVSVYTGVLLAVSFIPLWRSLVLPPLFFLSALSTGFAGGAGLGMITWRKRNLSAMEEPLRFLRRSYRIILPFYLLAALGLVFPLLFTPIPRTEAIHFLTGWSGLIWWVGVVGVGIIVPLILVFRKEEAQAGHLWLLFSCLLAGGFLLRLILVLAGQGAI